MSHPTDRQAAEKQAAENFAASARDLTAEEVKAYLLTHPEILANDVELIGALVPPSHASGRNVLDMQQFMIERLQRQVRTLRDIQSELIEASSLNSLAREQVHIAALTMLDARSFEELIDYLTTPRGLATALNIHAVAFCIEAPDDKMSHLSTRGLRVLEPKGVTRILGGDHPHRLAAYLLGSESLYGAAAGNVRSEALVRLDFSPASPPGLLALGGHDPEQFHPEQAVDLLDFLARVVERCVRRWLDLPPPR